MTNKQSLARRNTSPSASLEEEDRATRPGPGSLQPQAGPDSLAALQDQVGNLAVQQLLAQDHDQPAAAVEPDIVAEMVPTLDPAEEPAIADPALPPAEAAQLEPEPVEAGLIRLEPPEIEYYDIAAASLAEATARIKPPEQQTHYRYHYHLTVDQNRVVRVDITVAIKLYLPRWTGPGWDEAPPRDQAQWLEQVESGRPPHRGEALATELPQNLLLGPAWTAAPQALKSDWRSLLESVQQEEQGPLDVARRRAMVLQQRLLYQPEPEAAAIFDRFLQDIQAEETIYHRRRKAGRETHPTLTGPTLVQ